LSLHRLPEPPRRSRRLLVCGMATALLVVPGVAHASPVSTDPLSSAGKPIQDAVGGVLTNVTGGQSTGDTQGDGTDESQQGVQTTAPTPTVPALDPAQLAALLAPLGVSPDCFSAVQGDVVAVLGSVPATVQQLITMLGDKLDELQENPENGPALLQEALTDLLGGAIPGAASTSTTETDSTGVPLLSALQDLVQDFLDVCLPKPEVPTSTPPTTAAPAAVTSTPPPAVAAPTSAAPVAYLGYAPTGADEDSDDDSGLAVLGGVLLLSGAAAGSWMWSRRAASSRG
jgi:hypothetical protein